MQVCKNCNISMKNVMSFSKSKNERYYRCPRCYNETKHQRIDDDELKFGEVLNKSIHKRK